LEKHVDKFMWFELGSLQKAIFSVVANRINRLVLVGKLRKDIFFKNDESLDKDTNLILGKLSDRKDYSILSEVSKLIGKFGLEIIDPSPFLQELIPQKGLLTKRAPTEQEAEDIRYAVDIARELARFDIGQTVAVKNKTVIALEAVEGTDATVVRAGSISNKGFVVAKVARPNQDMRFDVPLVGLETAEALIKAGATALALEGGKTFLINKEEIIKLADANNLAIIIV
jgi:Uncharacterized protein conserved in bacteria